jgi:outer membrane cobalamin receptor
MTNVPPTPSPHSTNRRFTSRLLALIVLPALGFTTPRIARADDGTGDATASSPAPKPDASGETSEPASSDETVRVEAPLVVTATRSPQPKQAVSTTVETLSKKEIERSGARNLGELLAQRSLVDIHAYGPLGSLQLPYLRGFSAEQTLVMIDGRRLNPPQGGGADLSDIDLQGIRRIEILHGPASALYGSDAMGGVIQLFTDAPGGPAQSDLSEETGSFGYRSLRFSRSEKLPRLGYVFSARRETSRGDFSYFDPIRQQTLDRKNSGFDSNALRATLLPQLKGPGKLTVDADWSQSKRGAPGPLESPSAAIQEDRLATLQATYRSSLSARGPSSSESRPGSFELKAYLQGQRRLFDGSKDRPIPTYTLQKAGTTGLEGTIRQVFGKIKLTYGSEFRHETVRGNPISEHRRDVWGSYALGEISLGPWTLLPAARWDRIAGVGSQVSPQLGAVRRLSSAWSLRANVGKAFRAPSFNDLYWPPDPFSVGNPDLRPERATTGDLGATYARGLWDASLTAYRTSARDLIVWTPGALQPGKWSPVNVNRARIRGIELTAGYRSGDWAYRFGGSLQSAQDRTPGISTFGKQLTYRPAGNIHANADWRKDRWGAGADFVYEGRRYASADNSARLGGYALLNLRVSRAFGDWEARLLLNDVFDKRYQLQAGYPLPGREFRLDLTQRF